MTTLNNFKDAATKLSYGLTVEEAHSKNICIVCKKKIELGDNILTPAGEREYQISGFCETCFMALEP